jgi:hypothetical protein
MAEAKVLTIANHRRVLSQMQVSHMCFCVFVFFGVFNVTAAYSI